MNSKNSKNSTDEKVIWQGWNSVQKDGAFPPAAMLIVLFVGIFLGAPLMNREMNSYAAGIAIMVFFALPFIISFTSCCIIGRKETRYTVTENSIKAVKKDAEQAVPLDDVLRVRLVKEDLFRSSVMLMTKDAAERVVPLSVEDFKKVWDMPLADRLYSLKNKDAELIYRFIDSYIEKKQKGDT